MTEIRPFRALRYAPEHSELSRVLAPPYDVIDAAGREHYYRRDPHNAIRLELTRRVDEEADTDYSHVQQTLATWQTTGILRRDAVGRLYGLRQRFHPPGETAGEGLCRDGFFALLRLADYGDGPVRPHERTLAAPVVDRLKLLRATRANVSPVFFLYEDPAGELASALGGWLGGAEGEGATARDEDGTQHTLVSLPAPAALARAAAFLRDRPVVIADGHHRYHTALRYRAERRAAVGNGTPDAPHDYVLGYFTNARAPGSLLLPIHRILLDVAPPPPTVWAQHLPGWTQKCVDLPHPDALPELLRAHLEPHDAAPAFAADDGTGALRVFVRPRRGPADLPIRAIHSEVIENVFGLDAERVRRGRVAFAKAATAAARRVRTAPRRVAIYVNALRPADVFAVTARGEVLPPKSTYFYPKLPTGLLLRTLDGPEAPAGTDGPDRPRGME